MRYHYMLIAPTILALWTISQIYKAGSSGYAHKNFFLIVNHSEALIKDTIRKNDKGNVLTDKVTAQEKGDSVAEHKKDGTVSGSIQTKRGSESVSNLVPKQSREDIDTDKTVVHCSKDGENLGKIGTEMTS